MNYSCLPLILQIAICTLYRFIYGILDKAQYVFIVDSLYTSANVQNMVVSILSLDSVHSDLG